MSAEAFSPWPQHDDGAGSIGLPGKGGGVDPRTAVSFGEWRSKKPAWQSAPALKIIWPSAHDARPPPCHGPRLPRVSALVRASGAPLMAVLDRIAVAIRALGSAAGAGAAHGSVAGQHRRVPGRRGGVGVWGEVPTIALRGYGGSRRSPCLISIGARLNSNGTRHSRSR